MKQRDKEILIFGAMVCLSIIITGITIPSAWAETIYSGECNSIEFPNEEPVNWSVEGNNSDMDGFSYEKNKTNITYCFHPLFKSDNFTITFYNYQEVEVDSGNSGGSSGGSSCKYDENFDWQCGSWGECISGQQIRTCKKYNNCHNTYGKPKEIQNCLVQIQQNDTGEPPIIEEKNNTKRWIIAVISILIISLIIIWMLVYFKNKKQKTKNQRFINKIIFN